MKDAITEVGIETFFAGLARVTQSPRIKQITEVPYGDSPRQTLDVFLPKDQPPKYNILFIHGGSWQYGSKNQYRFLGQALAEQGIACVVVNYRLFPQVRFPGFVEDGAQALRWVQTSGHFYGLHSAPTFVMGHSAGVQIALLALLDPVYAAHYDLDLKQILGVICLAGAYSFRPEKSPRYQQIFPAAACEKDYRNVKPVNFVQPGGIPLYLLHGRKDKTVACRSAERMYKNALLVGHPVHLQIWENHGHAGLLFDFIKYSPNHQRLMVSLTNFMQDCVE